ncbi:MAG: response regulator transcription factor [Bacteroidetes bacterium]|nr:response regulator transcription factor [Bacteroidota bacterium]MBS1939813.1 response regulator transcription factor [Bacteroidota bacterium]
MQRPTALLIDDEPDALDALATAIEAFCPEIHVVGTAASGLEALAAIAQLNPQVLFCDIRMPDMSGLELMERLGADKERIVVFVTAHDDQGIKAVKLQAFDYLLKPIDVEELASTVERIVAKLRRQDPLHARLRIYTQRGTELIDPARVVRIEADGSYCLVHLTEGKPMLVSRKLGEMEEDIEGRGFIRVHRSHLVNAAHVKRFVPGREGAVLVMSNGEQVEVARGRRHLFT